MPAVPNSVMGAFSQHLQSDDDMVDVLWQYVAPEMEGLERERKAVLLTLASPDDGEIMRGRVHTLFWGAEGTGKSVLRNWVRSAYPQAIGVGPKSSGPGLKGSMQGGNYTPGALHTAHMTDAPVAIDELDEFESADRGALLEAMSDGEYDITQAGEIMSVPAETRVVAAANRTDHFRAELIDRFDLVLEVTEYGMEETVDVTDTLYDNFRRDVIRRESMDDGNPLIDYLQWVQDYDPTINDDAHDTISDMAAWLIREYDLAGDIRQKETYYRVAYTVARLNRRAVTPDDFITAVDLVHDDADMTAALRDRYDR